tara:strand:+ start:259 stop:540 length:282 start_codon:yes stop_codon:yes gene_type:complete
MLAETPTRRTVGEAAASDGSVVGALEVVWHPENANRERARIAPVRARRKLEEWIEKSIGVVGSEVESIRFSKGVKGECGREGGSWNGGSMSGS